MTEALIEHLPLIADAPDGIKALRGLILDLAVRGKLVPQDPNDEPARKLLERIHTQTLGKRRKVNDCNPEAGRREEVYPTPSSWRWASVDALVRSNETVTYGILKPVWVGDGIPTVRVTEMKTGEIDVSALPRCDPARASRFEKTTLVSGDLLISKDGTIGKTAFVPPELAGGNITQHVLRFPITDLVDRHFIRLAIDAPYCQAWMAGESKGVALQGVNVGDFRRMPLPLPPLAEQRRIVAKVDELMALCDRLEAQQADAEVVHATLVKTLLETLTQSQDADDFAANWQCLSQHFPTIFTTEASVDALKQAIVKLAVTGKLVPQKPGDEPAAAFLRRVRSARAQLIARKVIKADKLQPALMGDALPFGSPSGWEWVRFDEVVLISGGLTLGRAFAGRELVTLPYLRVANVQRGHLALTEVKKVSVPPEEVEKYRLRPQDLLITEGGDWDKVGRTAIWRGEIEDCLHQNHVFKARPFVPDFNDRWTELYLNSAIARSYFAGASKQTTNLASINMTQLKGCLLPIPPIEEQRRIVAKVDELLALCDTLKAQIAESRNVQRQLAAALVEQTLAA